MKKRDEGYFVNHGKDFRLRPTFTEEIDRRDSEGSIKNWETVRTSSLPKECGLHYLRVTTKQYTYPKSRQTNSEQLCSCLSST
jgi:hypothetical protein